MIRPRSLLKTLAAFARAKAGNLALAAALGAPALIGAGALTLDYVNAWSAHESLQSAADGAALAAATELPLRSTSRTTVESIVNGYVRNNVGRNFDITNISSEIMANRSGVVVRLSGRVPSFLGGLFNPQGYAPSVESTARLSGGAPLCALALEEHAANAISLEKSARLLAPNCAVMSNSASPQGISALDSSTISATTICSSGGTRGSASNFRPAAITDCPVLHDPLAGREEPAAGGCDHLLALSVIGNRNLTPGVYCGGLIITPGATATLSPGIYVMKNGPLLVMGNGALVGQNVGFYFVGDLSTMTFAAPSRIDLTAPKDGPMAGFLFFANRVLLTANLNLRHFRISSNNARNLLGTIYLRDGVLDVDSQRPIADQSAYTVIVARRMQVTSGPDLVLNTDYEGTDVPVPDGVGPMKPHAFLSQ